MTILIIIGVITTCLGLGGLVHCIREARTIKRDGLTGPDAQVRLRGLLAINLGAVAVAFIGLAMVVVGVIL